MLRADSRYLFYYRMEHLVELVDGLRPNHLPVGDGIKLLLDTGREIVIHNRRKTFHEEIIDHRTDIGRKKFSPVGTDCLSLLFLRYPAFAERQDHVGTLYPFFISFHDIFPVLYRLDSRSISRRTANAQFLEPANQTGLGIARRTLRETLCRHGLLQAEAVVQADRRE